MVRIRLRRVGAKKQPSYRIVVADQHSPRDGRFIESIGHYNPRTEPETVQYDEERALYWLSVGAQPTEAVRRLLNNGGTYARLERLHKGESIEALVEEALAEAEKRAPGSPKTRHETAKSPKKSKKKAEVAEAGAAAEATEEATEETTEETVAEAEPAEGKAAEEVAEVEPAEVEEKEATDAEESE